MWYYLRIFIGIFIIGNLFLNFVWCGSAIDDWNQNLEETEGLYAQFNNITSQNNIDYTALYNNVLTTYELELEALEIWDNREVCFRFYYDGNYPSDYIEFDIDAFESWAILTEIFELNITPYNENWLLRETGY